VRRCSLFFSDPDKFYCSRSLRVSHRLSDCTDFLGAGKISADTVIAFFPLVPARVKASEFSSKPDRALFPARKFSWSFKCFRTLTARFSARANLGFTIFPGLFSPL